MSLEFGVSGSKFSLFLLTFYCLLSLTSAQNKPCQFDAKTLQFSGTPIEQAKCLLRPNNIGGVLSDELEKLPRPLEMIIGEAVRISPERLRKYLAKQQVTEVDLGGSLDEKLSIAKLSDGQEIQALYFIIHDTSSPYLKDADEFPLEINNADWRGNDLEIWLKNPVAHIFVNRAGDSITTTPFSEAARKGWGTKFARDFLKTDGKGLQLHIELIQPRRPDRSNSNPNNDLIAPKVGFPVAQYKRLALLYICASVRRGIWLIPAYHSAIDAGIKDAHDDPQNFRLDKFARELQKLIGKL